MSTTRRRTSLFLLAAPACFLAGTAGTAAGQERSAAAETTVAQGITVRSDGWIQYAPQLATAGAKANTVRVAGTRNADGGCTLAGSSTAAAGDLQTTYTEEVGYNPATCEFDLRTTNVTPQQLTDLSPSAQTNSSALSATNPVVISKPTESLQAAAAATTYNRYLKTSWIDPIHITITSQTVALRWTSKAWKNWAYKRDSFKGCIAGVCLDKTYIVSGSDSFTTLSNGWKKQANVHFRNTSFALWVVAVLGPTGWAACGFPLRLDGQLPPPGHRHRLQERRVGVELERPEGRRMHEPRASR